MNMLRWIELRESSSVSRFGIIFFRGDQFIAYALFSCCPHVVWSLGNIPFCYMCDEEFSVDFVENFQRVCDTLDCRQMSWAQDFVHVTRGRKP